MRNRIKKIFKKYNIDKTELVNPLSWKSIKSFFKNLLSVKGNPSKIALSLAIGIFIGIMMPVGLQLAVVIPLSLAFNLNILITITATFVTNPITVIPLYFAIIKTGEFLTQINISWSKIEALIENPQISAFINLGYESLVVFFSGSITLGLIISITLYYITLRLINKNRLKNS